jgi:hypothetical protein
MMKAESIPLNLQRPGLALEHVLHELIVFIPSWLYVASFSGVFIALTVTYIAWKLIYAFHISPLKHIPGRYLPACPPCEAYGT